MSHTLYPFSLTKESLPRQHMILRNVASAKYGGDWYSIPHAHSYTELFISSAETASSGSTRTSFPCRSISSWW